MDPPENLLCTSTGQVADSLGSENVFTLTKKRAASVIPKKQPVASAGEVDRLRSRLVEDIRRTAVVGVRPGGPPPQVRSHRSILRDGYNIDVISYQTERGVYIPGLILTPELAGPKPAILVVDSRPKQITAATGGDLEDLVKSGYIVLSIQPRGISETPQTRRPSLIGDQSLAALATVTGKTLVGMRVEDIMRGVDYLVSRSDVNRDQILAFGQGVLGVPVLHAAVMDDRITRVILQETLVAYRMAIDRPVHRNLYEVAIPGVLKKYDLDELLLALSPRAVTIINPVDALGKTVRTEEFGKYSEYVIDADAKLGQPRRLQLKFKGRRDRLVPFIRPHT
jgi:hypothetical protein